MRKLILIIALTMVPLGIWTAGCRNDNRQAAFPNTPEMKALAKTAEKDNPTAAPVIPPRPIDREILNLPEHDTVARVQAVNDRANQYAAKEPNRGMFTLPEEKNYVASAFSAPTYDKSELQAAPAAMIPVPSAREFWSRPSTRSGSGTGERPADVSAMAGPARESVKVPPTPPAARRGKAAPDNFILPPDDMPGVFMVGEEDAPLDNPPPSRGWFGMLRKNKGDALGAPPLSSRRPDLDSRAKAEVIERGPMKLDIDRLMGLDGQAAAPVSTQVGTAGSMPAPRMALAEQRFAASAPEAFPPIAPGARIVSSVGMNFEPLPEPIPLEQYNAMVGRGRAMKAPAAKRVERVDTAAMPVLPLPAALISGAPAAAAVAAPAIPELMEAKMTVEKTAKTDAAKIPGAVEFANAEKALEPLPDLATLGPVPGRTSMKGKVVAMPKPMPEALPTPEAAVAKAALMEFTPEAMDEAFAELNKTDFFKTDFWDPAAKAQMKAEAMKDATAERKAAGAHALPELTDPAAVMMPAAPPMLEPEKTESILPGLSGLVDAAPAKAAPAKKAAVAEPQKVTLQPMRKIRAIPELDHIDSAMEAPPMKF